VAQAVECLPSEHDALASNPNISKNNKNKKSKVKEKKSYFSICSE
jgi:hypothetical protein